jgi:hypothetical protein
MADQSFQPSRRAFIEGATILAGAAALPAAWAASAMDETPAKSVVTFYMDELIIDRTGKSPAYRPPAGLRSAGPVEHLSDAEIRLLQGWA